MTVWNDLCYKEYPHSQVLGTNRLDCLFPEGVPAWVLQPRKNHKRRLMRKWYNRAIRESKRQWFKITGNRRAAAIVIWALLKQPPATGWHVNTPMLGVWYLTPGQNQDSL